MVRGREREARKLVAGLGQLDKEPFFPESIPASDNPGNMQYSPIEAAPGRYVKEKSN